MSHRPRREKEWHGRRGSREWPLGEKVVWGEAGKVATAVGTGRLIQKSFLETGGTLSWPPTAMEERLKGKG